MKRLSGTAFTICVLVALLLSTIVLAFINRPHDTSKSTDEFVREWQGHQIFNEEFKEYLRSRNLPERIVESADLFIDTQSRENSEYVGKNGEIEDHTIVCNQNDVAVFAEASETSAQIGVLSEYDASKLLSIDGDWYQIESGKVTGYAYSTAFYTGDDAFALDKSTYMRTAKVSTNATDLFDEASTDAEVVSILYEDSEYPIITYDPEWLLIEDPTYGYGYMSARSASVLWQRRRADTMEEAAQKEALKKKGAELYAAMKMAEISASVGGGNTTASAEVASMAVETAHLLGIEFIHPVPGGFKSSDYGARWGVWHHGTDIACVLDTPEIASYAGTVVSVVQSNEGYGNMVLVEHENGFMTRYAHMNSTAVSVGQHVEQGDILGYAGTTGNSTGVHCHFEIIFCGYTVNPELFVTIP